jgi:lipoate-protein ligase B
MLSTAEKTRNNTLAVHDCGLADYQHVLQLQHQLHKKRRLTQIPNIVLIVEHPPVITLGARASANKLLAEREKLAQDGIEVVQIRRGGGTTAHNPGQLVFYPILYLPDLGLGISEYIRELEAVGAELLGRLGVQSRRRRGLPGVWVGSKKIASIGVRVSKGITYHGMAVNIQNDLGIFDLLIPCGLDGVEMTSVRKETGRRQPMNVVKRILAELLIEHFGKRGGEC